MKKIIYTILILVFPLLGHSQVDITDSVLIVHFPTYDWVKTFDSLPLNDVFTYLGDYTTATNARYFSSSGSASNTGRTEASSLPMDSINTLAVDSGTAMIITNDTEWKGTITPRSNLKYIGLRENNTKPVIRGTTLVTEWQQLPRNNNIYYSLVTGLGTPNLVIVDDELLRISSYPSAAAMEQFDFETVYSSITSVINRESYINDTLLFDNTLPNVDLTGASVLCRTVGWANYKSVVKGMPNDSTLQLEDGVYAMDIGDPYRVINNPDLIDGNSQYAYRGDTLFVQLATNPNNYTIEIPTVEYAMYADTEVENISIRGLSFKGFNHTGIMFADSIRNVEISDNIFDKTYYSAISAKADGNELININNNYIEYSNYQGIALKSDSSEVSNNIINKHGLMNYVGTGAFHIIPGNNVYANAAGSAIFIYQCDNNKIEYNTIDSVGYNGIFFAGKRDTVRYNLISNVNLVLNDGGAIYGSGDMDGTLVAYNILFDNGFPNTTDYTHGVYFDNYTINATVENNTCYGNLGHGVFLHNTGNITMQYNTLYNNSSTQLAANDWTGLEQYIENNNVEHNIFFTKTNTSELYFETDFPVDSTTWLNLDSNYYCNPYTAVGIPRDWESNPFTLDTLYETQIVTDTISGDLLTNGTFDTDASNWFAGAYWLANTPIGTGGGLGGLRSSTGFAFDSYNLSYSVTDSATFLLIFDHYSNGDAVTANSFIRDTYDFDEIGLSSGLDHYKGFLTISENVEITSRFRMLTTGTVSDSTYYDNIHMYEVETDAVDQEVKSELFFNTKTTAVAQDLTGFTWKDLEGNAVTELTLQPFTSKILIKD